MNTLINEEDEREREGNRSLFSLQLFFLSKRRRRIFQNSPPTIRGRKEEEEESREREEMRSLQKIIRIEEITGEVKENTATNKSGRHF